LAGDAKDEEAREDTEKAGREAGVDGTWAAPEHECDHGDDGQPSRGEES